MMQHFFKTFRHWPFDKQLTVFFPTGILLVAMISGSILAIDPMANKAALFAGFLFVLFILIIRPRLHQNYFSPKTEWFLREFWPVSAILLGYLTMRVLRLELAVDYFNIPLRDDWMIELDNALFGQPVPLAFQHWISPGLTLWMEFAYLHFYYLLPIGSLLYFFWRGQHQTFLQLRKALIYTLTGGFCFYFMLPVMGPVMYMPDQFAVPLPANHAILYDAVNSFRFLYDCFPSLHTAIPWLTLFMTWTLHPWPARGMLLFMAISITLSTLYLRYHYGTDVVAGFLWALLVAQWIKHRPADRQSRLVPTLTN